jgi:ABC-type transport system involved in multi-copper enzyme maturation permease subunit
MLLTIIKKEILTNLLNLRFGLAYFLCTVLIVGSGAVLVSEYCSQRKLYDVNTAVYRHQLEGVDGAYSWQYSTQRTVAREPLVTSVFVQGTEKDADQQATMSSYFSPKFYGELRRNPLANLFPTIDLTFVVGIIFSLLIFALAFDAVAGEREGTLKVLLAGPVPRAMIISAKWIGTFMTVMAPCVTAWIASCLLLALNPAVTIPAGDWLRIVGVFAVSALYAAAIVSLAIMVSTIFRHGTTVLLALLLGWVVVVAAIPSLSGPVAGIIGHAPSSQQADIKVLRYGTWLEKEGIAPNPAMTNLVEHELAGRNYDSLSRQEQQRIDSLGQEVANYWDAVRVDKVAEVEGQHEDRLAAVDQLSRWISRLSPYGCYQQACVSLAGTGMAREHELSDGVHQYNRAVLDYVADASRRCGDCFLQSYGPVISVRRTPLSAAAAEALPDIAIMALMAVLFFMIAFVSFVRAEAT